MRLRVAVPLSLALRAMGLLPWVRATTTRCSGSEIPGPHTCLSIVVSQEYLADLEDLAREDGLSLYRTVVTDLDCWVSLEEAKRFQQN